MEPGAMNRPLQPQIGMNSVCPGMMFLMLSSVLILTAMAAARPLCFDEETEELEGSLPLLLLSLPPHHQATKGMAQKRNSELLNTLLGSQGLSHMRSAGRR
ncbi:uncharacterized protein [Cherax quadricarinatus]|uniref:uncharacterized protein n=1 Tax=Cherax quadricarinatus TaxID=27406 RepID=UPI002378B1B6|nr:uncharacterized protein LOC128701999 [Cherax quadricarinatus]